MDALTVVLLVVIALLAILQSALLVRLASEARRTVRGLERMADRLVDGLSPVAGDLARAAENAERVSEQALERLRRLDSTVGDASAAWSRATAYVHESLMPTVGRLAAVGAAWRILRRARAIYRRLRG